jgi:predicted Fe-Mo cluster-binding NifX family protein
MKAIGKLGETGFIYFKDKSLDIYAVRSSMKTVEEFLKS